MAAPTFVSSASTAAASATSTSSSVAATAPASIVAGNLLVAFVYDSGSSSLGKTPAAAPSGWTLQGSGATASGSWAVYTKPATAAEPASYTFGFTNSSSVVFNIGALISQYAGVDGNNIDGIASNTNGSSTSSQLAPALTHATAGLLLTMVGAFAGGGITFTSPAGATQRATVNINANGSAAALEQTMPAVSPAPARTVGTSAATKAIAVSMGLRSNALNAAGTATRSTRSASGAATGGLTQYPRSGTATRSRTASGTALLPTSAAGTATRTRSGTGAAALTITAATWTRDQSQSGYRNRGGSGVAVVDCVPAVPDTLIEQINHVMPAPTLDSSGRPDPDLFVPTETRTTWGSYQLIIGNRDVTTWHGIPTVIESYEDSEPFGDARATFLFPGIHPFESLTTRGYRWLRAGSPIRLLKVNPNGTVHPNPLFEGITGHRSRQDGALRVECLGSLYQADLQQKPPSFNTDPLDVGTAISRALNEVVGRNYAHVPAVTTDVPTRSRGSWTPRLTGYVQDLLATAYSSDGSNQWTVLKRAGRVPAIVLKDRTTVNWTITTGTQGLTVDLEQDPTLAPTTIFGQGTDSEQCTWRNSKYPNLHLDSSPAYPYASASTVMTVGSTDAGTASGTGVSDWQREAARLGFGTGPTGTYSSADAAACRALQYDAGISVDGVVGPQTWAATFDVGSNAGDLSGAYFAPLASLPAVEPWLFNADGSRRGRNPSYDRTRLRVERFETMGDGISKAQGIASARAELARDSDPGYTGTLTLAIDPQSGSRLDIRSGQNILLRSYEGADRLLHIAKREVAEGVVTLTVDTNARDAATLAAILDQQHDATDPARTKRNPNRTSRNVEDTRAVFDCENGGGMIPRHAQYQRLWSVLRIPVGETGAIARVEATTSSPATPFSMAVFGAPVTAAQVRRLLGNPFQTVGAAGSSPFDVHADQLDAMAFQWAAGGPGQAAGYYPEAQSTISGGTGPVTGRLVDDGGWTYRSFKPPWLWVAIYTSASCFHEGRLFHAPDS